MAHPAILNGPSKWDLMLSLFDSREVNLRVVSFTVESGDKKFQLDVTVSEVVREDGSGESWLLQGYTVPTAGFRREFKAWYRTDRRVGWIEW